MYPEWILRLAEFLGPRIPACCRRVPDFCGEYIRGTETKLAVPFYSQTDWYSCGPVAASIVLEAFHPKASFSAFYRECRPVPLEGTSEWKLVQALRRFGVGVSVRRGLGFEEIVEAIEAGFPIIAGMSDGPDDEYGHWGVIYGVNRKPRRIFLCNVGCIGNSRVECSWRDWKGWWDPAGAGLICWGKNSRDV